MSEDCKVNKEAIDTLKKEVDIIKNENKNTREQLIRNNVVTEQVAKALPSLTKTMNNINSTMVEMKENIGNLNKGYDDLKIGQDEMKKDLNDKVAGLEKEFLNDRQKNMIDMRDWFKKHWGKIAVVILLGYELIIRALPSIGNLIK
jgi:chromosome segregation ATPase